MTRQWVVVGGGGLGREIVQYVRADIARGTLQGIELAGVIDDGGPSCEVCSTDPGIGWLGTTDTVEPRDGWAAVVAVGSVKARKTVVERLLARGWSFATYVHSSAIVAADATLGTGTFVGPQSVINSGARVGEHCCINVFCSVGHGAVLGDFGVMSPYAALNGNAKVGAKGFLGTRATVYPGVGLGESCIVDTHAHVKASVGDRKIVSVRGQYLVLDNRMGV